MDDTTKQIVQAALAGLVRHGMTTAAGALVAAGLLQSGDSANFVQIATGIVLGVVALGFFMSPSESSPLLLPSVKGLRRGAVLALFLSVPAAIAAYLCWLFSRLLHRLS